ncbi:MAG: transporter [Halobacteriovoraceae bacterium]|nr:transporter [Halobacteriovoraceae bacterium]|tara:strand:+ start:3311 stop:4066 length:756 start_codon:yes stop_codon:yes gene_type:complete
MNETTETNTEQQLVDPNQALTEVPSGPQELNAVQGFAKFMDDGGVFMWIILGMWVFGIIISVERIKNLFQYDIDGTSLMNQVKKDVLTNEVQNAIQNCSTNKSLLAQVLRNGLKRANQSKEQIQDALESSMLEAIPHLEKRLGYLSLIANVSTLIGLLGTIYGLIQSFAAVASADPASKAELLALGISKAMNTTAFGLISAITIMVIHQILTTKSEKIIADLEHYSVKLVDLLSTRKSAPSTQQQNHVDAA